MQIVANKKMPSVTLAPGVILKNIKCDGAYFSFTVVNRRQISVGILNKQIKIKFFDFDGDPVPHVSEFNPYLDAESAEDQSDRVSRKCTDLSKARITHTVK